MDIYSEYTNYFHFNDLHIDSIFSNITICDIGS